MRTFALVLALLAGLIADGPQSTRSLGVVIGTVADAATATPLSGVQIYADGLMASTLTARDGGYLLRLPAAATGEVTIRAELIGYRSMTKQVSLGADSVRVDFALESTRREDRVAPTMDELAVSIVTANEPAVQRSRGVGGAVVPSQAAVAAQARLLAPRELDRSAYDLRGRYNPNFEREGYERIYENEFRAVGSNPLSTFGIDVDRASYANVRRFIREGQLPPADAVRIEELINYFTYDFAAPEGPDPFSVRTEVAPAPWNPLHHLVRIGIQGRKIDTDDLPATNLVFLLDVSGSMRPANKLPLLKSALRLLVDQVRPQDRIAIVVYAGAAGLVLEPTPGSEKGLILAALDRLEAGGSTAGGAGLQLAYDVARRYHVEGGNNRIILATDGDFNVGASSDAEMVRLIEERREEGTFLTVLGFGTGNLQDAKMEKLADHGNGNFAYIDTVLEARKVLVSEFGGTLHTIAKDVKVQVEFNPTRVRAYRLIGYENRMLAAEDFSDDTKDAGDLGAGHTVTALYEVIPAGVASATPVRGLDDLRYQSTEVRIEASSPELMFVKLRYKDPDGKRSRLVTHPVMDGTTIPSSDFTFAASVAAFAMVLRDSRYCGATDLEEVLRWARNSVGADREGYRREFLELVREAHRLSGANESDGAWR